MKVEDTICLDIVDIDDKGVGYGYYNRKKINVRYSIPGDKVKVKIKTIRKGRYKEFWGVLIDFISPAQGRITPKCKHFGVCGGCIFQNWDYRYQLNYKKNKVVGAFSSYDLDVSVNEPIPSPKIYYYRNRMDYSVALINSSPVIGLRVAGRWDIIIDLDECHLMSLESVEIIKEIKKFMVKKEIAPYNIFSHKGFMRYVIIREGKFTGERLISLVTNLGPFPYLDELISLLSSYSTGIIWSINPKITDLSIGEEIRPLYGNDHLNEMIKDIIFYIHPNAFFQTNSYQTLNLVNIIYNIVEEGNLLLDLYSGVGLFAFALADKYNQIIGVESDDYSVYSANINKERYGIKHIKFIKDSVENMLSEFKEHPTTVVFDPPRPGISIEAKKYIIKLRPREIIYISCNPFSMARDVNALSETYLVEDSIQPIDMFPQTPHIESIAKLILKD